MEKVVYENPERIAIAGALLSIRKLPNQQLVTLNLAVGAGWACNGCDGYEIVKHLFDNEGHLLHPILKDAFAHEVNRRVEAGEWDA